MTPATKAPGSGVGGVVFAWPGRARVTIVLPAFLVLSLLAHIAVFFIFQVVYPQRVTIPPAAPQVLILSPETAEAKSLLDWVDAQDPALGMTAAQTAAPRTFEVPYLPSYSIARTPPRTVPLPEGAASRIPPQETLLWLRRLESKTPDPGAAPQPDKTRISITGPLAERNLLEGTIVGGAGPATVQPSRFLVGADQAGGVQHALLQRSSGNAALDASAARQLMSLKFATGEQEWSWGFVTVEWGNEKLPTTP